MTDPSIDNAVFIEYQKRIELQFQALSERITTVEKLRDREIILADKALQAAKENMEQRLEGLNQLRRDVTEDRAQFVESREFNPVIETLKGAVAEIKLVIANWDGRFWMLGAGMTVLLVAIQILMNWYKK